MNKFNPIYIGVLMLCLPHLLVAQTTDSLLHRTVVVESRYNPDIMNANKVNVQPTLIEPQIEKKKIEFATTMRPVRNFPFAPMPSLAANPYVADASRGYLRAGLGNNGNIDALFNYSLSLGKRDRLDTQFSFQGMNTDLDVPGYPGEEWNARSYRLSGNVDWRHMFNTVLVDVTAQGESQVFSYMDNLSGIYRMPNHQTNHLGALSVEASSRDRDADVGFRIGTGLYLARQKYVPNEITETGWYSNEYSDNAETNIKTYARLWGDITPQSTIELNARMDNYMYSGTGKNHTLIQLNPAFVYAEDEWTLRAGAHIDWQIAFDAGISFSPDVQFAYNFAKGYNLYAKILGECQINDFRKVNTIYPYSLPYLGWKNTYVKTDGRLGVKASPLNNLSLDIHTGYRIVENELFCCLKQGSVNETFAGLKQGKAKVYYTALRGAYNYKDYLTTEVSITYNLWDSHIVDNYMTMHPLFELCWRADWNPIERWHFGLTYNFQQRVKSEEGSRFNSINELGANISYKVLPMLAIQAKGGNLLNCSYSSYVFLPVQGIHFLLGAAVDF